MKRFMIFAVASFLSVIGWIVSDIGSQDTVIRSLPMENASAQNAEYGSAASLNSTVNEAALRTFRGASEDGKLRVDETNHLVIDLQLRHWFDFHLSAVGELSIADIRNVMTERIMRLPLPARDEALAVLSAYLGYLDALAAYDETTALKNQMSDASSRMLTRLEWQQRLRREWLQPDVVTAFFTADELIDNYTLQKLALLRNGANATELKQLDESLPEVVQVMREQSQSVLTLNQEMAQMQAQNVSAEDQYAWQVREYGEEAAQRLAQVKQRQEEWQQRLKDYRHYKQSPELQRLAQQDRDDLLQTYRDAHFTSLEQKRIGAALALLKEE